jgi:ABC-type maltose transport system permease subunit
MLIFMVSVNIFVGFAILLAFYGMIKVWIETDNTLGLMILKTIGSICCLLTIPCYINLWLATPL